MLCGDETVSTFIRWNERQVLSSPTKITKTVVQAHDAVFLRIGTTTPGDQSVKTARVTLRKQLAERQGDSSSHGVGKR